MRLSAIVLNMAGCLLDQSMWRISKKDTKTLPTIVRIGNELGSPENNLTDEPHREARRGRTASVDCGLEINTGCLVSLVDLSGKAMERLTHAIRQSRGNMQPSLRLSRASRSCIQADQRA